jgi:hypothetical protein
MDGLYELPNNYSLHFKIIGLIEMSQCLPTATRFLG